MYKANFIIILSFFVLTLKAFSHTPEEGKILATLGPFYYRTMITQDIAERHSPYLPGGALIAEGDLDDNGGVEIALFYLDKLYLREKGEVFIIEKIKRMYITTGYRHWFKDDFSAAFSVFSSYSMGDRRVIHNDISGRHPTSAEDITEYGFDFSFQWEFAKYGNFYGIADLRYSLSLTHKSHEDANVYGALIGLKYWIPKERLGKNQDIEDPY